MGTPTFSFSGVHNVSTCLSPRVGSANRTVNCSSSLAHTLCGTLHSSNVGVTGCNALLTAVTSNSGRGTLPLVHHFCGLNFGVRTARKATGFLHDRNVHAHAHHGLARNDARLFSTLHRKRVGCIVGAVSVGGRCAAHSNCRVHHYTIRGGIDVFASLRAMDILLGILRRVALNMDAVSTRWVITLWVVRRRGVCGVEGGRTLATGIFHVILGNSADGVATPKRFVGVTLRNGFLHHPVSMYS